MRRSTSVLVVASWLVTVWATGCAAPADSETADAPSGFPTAETEGVWRVEVNGNPATLRLLPGLARAELDVGCAPLLGAYTFSAEGRAGFTLPGRGDDDCADRAEQDMARAALERIERWEPDGEAYRLIGPGTELRLAPA